MRRGAAERAASESLQLNARGGAPGVVEHSGAP
jgi:hypothetical protein